MNKYQNAKIYKVVCDITNTTYYGSTINELHKRLYAHKKENNCCRTKIMKDPKIFLVENYPCENVEQLKQRERWYIENYECINKVLPGGRNLTHKEVYEKNKPYQTEYRKKPILCECGCIITQGAKGSHRKTKKHLENLKDKDFMEKQKIKLQKEYEKCQNKIKIIEEKLQLYDNFP